MLDDIDHQILKAIGLSGKAHKYKLENKTGRARSTIHVRVKRLLNRYIEEAGRERFKQIKGISKIYYRLTFLGVLEALSNLEKPEEIEQLVHNNRDKPVLVLADAFINHGLREDADFLIETLKYSVKGGFINPEKLDEKDAALILGIALLKKCHEKLEYFRVKASIESPIKLYYETMLTYGSMYAIISENTDKALESLKDFVRNAEQFMGKEKGRQPSTQTHSDKNLPTPFHTHRNSSFI